MSKRELEIFLTLVSEKIKDLKSYKNQIEIGKDLFGDFKKVNIKQIEEEMHELTVIKLKLERLLK